MNSQRIIYVDPIRSRKNIQKHISTLPPMPKSITSPFLIMKRKTKKRC
jgi:hypothetical protein